MSYVQDFKEGFKDFGHVVTTIVNFVLLFFVYLIGVGIVALPAKLMRKKFLNLKSERKSYWEDYDLGTESIENYYRPF